MAKKDDIPKELEDELEKELDEMEEADVAFLVAYYNSLSDKEKKLMVLFKMKSW